MPAATMSWCVVETHGLMPDRRTAGLFGVGLGPGVVGGRHVVCSARHFEYSNKNSRTEAGSGSRGNGPELRQCNVSEVSVKAKTRGVQGSRPNREHES